MCEGWKKQPYTYRDIYYTLYIHSTHKSMTLLLKAQSDTENQEILRLLLPALPSVFVFYVLQPNL